MFDFSRENIDLIKADLKDKLPKKRYEHTLGVAYTSAALAMRYGEDIVKAELAGILHDVAKGEKVSKLKEDMKILIPIKLMLLWWQIKRLKFFMQYTHLT